MARLKGNIKAHDKKGALAELYAAKESWEQLGK